MSNINLTDLQNSLPPSKIIQLVTALGSDEYVEKEDYIIFKTICHNEDAQNASLKLYYYKKDHRFVCYTDCGCSFNIFTLFQKRYDLLKINYNFYKDIILKVADGVSINNNSKSGFYREYESIYHKYKEDIPNIEYKHYNEEVLNSFTFFAAPEWLDDGISEEIMKLYNIRYSISQNKIIIPHYDKDNNLIGIRGRALNPEDIAVGKYMPLVFENISYAHPLSYNLYGLNLVKDNIRRLKTAFIAEGEKSPQQYGTMFGQDNNVCVASCGSSIHQYQIDLLIKSGAERIIIAYDKEGETNKEKEKYFNKLKSFCERYKNICNMGFIYDTKNLLELKQSPFDRGKDIFKQLYKEVFWL